MGEGLAPFHTLTILHRADHRPLCALHEPVSWDVLERAHTSTRNIKRRRNEPINDDRTLELP